jgi:serine/threonine-protein kinase HipA
MTRCLHCYQTLADNGLEFKSQDFHPVCSKKFFGQAVPPVLPYSEAQMEELAVNVLRERSTVTGVQPKISLELSDEGSATAPKRFTIVGLWGAYILKPPPPQYPALPEIEDLTMRLAGVVGVGVVPHSLIRLQSGSLAYITKRIDRRQREIGGNRTKEKVHLEDMCQLTERLTEEKYYGSYEQIGKTILKYSARPGLDVVNFMEQIVFSFLTGNADMHLKNFSLLHDPKLGVVLAPAYDMVATALVNPDDDEDLALTLNGKKKNITRRDFQAACATLKLSPKQQDRIFATMANARDKWFDHIDRSFLSEEMKDAYRTLLRRRLERLRKTTA